MALNTTGGIFGFVLLFIEHRRATPHFYRW